MPFITLGLGFMFKFLVTKYGDWFFFDPWKGVKSKYFIVTPPGFEPGSKV